MITQNRGFGKINVFFLLGVGILLVVGKKMVGVCGGSAPGVADGVFRYTRIRSTKYA